MQRSSYPLARQLCVLAVLLGLVGMHGLSQGQDEGCHGGALSVATVPMTMPAGDGATTHLVAAMHGMGSTCVFVQATDWPTTVPALLAIISLAAALACGTRRSWDGRPERSPPLAGVSLLRRVCVSLT